MNKQESTLLVEAFTQGSDYGQIIFETIFYKYQHLLMFLSHFSFKGGVILHFNEFESRLSNNELCRVWLKLARRGSRKCKKCRQQAGKQTD